MRTLLFSVFLMICLLLNGQEYQPLVVEGNSWSVVGWSWGNAWTHYYFIEGDTTINSIDYKKLYKTPDSLLQNDVAFWGGIREDTISKEVFYYFSEWSGENRLYKFGLEVNDTVTVWSLECQSFIARVLETDMITDLSGTERRRMKIEFYGGGPLGEYWIEGVGSTYGLISSGNYSCLADLNFDMLCFSKNTDLYLMNPLFDACHITQVGIRDRQDEKEKIQLVPNPVSGHSQITVPDSKTVKSIYLMDVFGNTIQELPSNTSSISRENLSPGIYFLRVATSEGEILNCRFIVL
jgi:hypothetical protein